MTTLINEAAVTFAVEAHDCDEAIAEHFVYGTEEENRADVAAIHELAARTVWGWCNIRVTATLGDFTGQDMLYACTYTSADDFLQSGYFEDMKHNAIADLKRNIKRAHLALIAISDLLPAHLTSVTLWLKAVRARLPVWGVPEVDVRVSADIACTGPELTYLVGDVAYDAHHGHACTAGSVGQDDTDDDLLALAKAMLECLADEIDQLDTEPTEVV